MPISCIERHLHGSWDRIVGDLPNTQANLGDHAVVIQAYGAMIGHGRLFDISTGILSTR